jgi:TPR repeat protein
MKKLFLLSALLVACTSGEQTLVFECEQQNQGEACNKLGKAREGEAAVAYYKKGCDLENTNSCVSLAEAIKAKDVEGALKALKFACDKGNTTACAKRAALLVETKNPDPGKF